MSRDLPVVVVDTSVALKWFFRHEELADQAMAVLQTFLQGDSYIAAPDLLFYELANVLRHKTSLTTAEVRCAASSLYGLGLDLIPVVAEVIEPAIDFARHYGITVYDASFVALAELMGASFITADGKLAQKLVGLLYLKSLVS